MKTLSKLEIQGNFFQSNKGHLQEPTANFIINGERLHAFPPRSETR